MNTSNGIFCGVIYFNCHSGTCYYTVLGWVTALENESWWKTFIILLFINSGFGMRRCWLYINSVWPFMHRSPHLLVLKTLRAAGHTQAATGSLRSAIGCRGCGRTRCHSRDRWRQQFSDYCQVGLRWRVQDRTRIGEGKAAGICLTLTCDRYFVHYFTPAILFYP